MRVDLASPEHGWMQITVRVDDQEVAMRASYLVDTITELAYAALDLIEQRPTRAVLVYGEPATHRVRLDGDGDEARLTISLHRDLEPARGAEPGEVRLIAQLPRVAIARAIWSGLRRIEGELGREVIERAMQTRWPVAVIAQLGERVRLTS
jgi:hypothetical protein